jgi:hypothetical protein
MECFECAGEVEVIMKYYVSGWNDVVVEDVEHHTCIKCGETTLGSEAGKKIERELTAKGWKPRPLRRVGL